MQAWTNCPNGQGFGEELFCRYSFPSPGVYGITQEILQSGFMSFWSFAATVLGSDFSR